MSRLRSSALSASAQMPRRMQRRSPSHRSVPSPPRRGARGPCACQVGVAISRLKPILRKRLRAYTATSASRPQFRAPIFRRIGQARRCSVIACAASLRMQGSTKLSPTRSYRPRRLISGVSRLHWLPVHLPHRRVPLVALRSCCRIRSQRTTTDSVAPSCRACLTVLMPIFATAQPRVRSLKLVAGTASRRVSHRSGPALPSRSGGIVSRARRARPQRRGTSTN